MARTINGKFRGMAARIGRYDDYLDSVTADIEPPRLQEYRWCTVCEKHYPVDPNPDGCPFCSVEEDYESPMETRASLGL